jgi:hypothetical protein
MKKKLFIAFGAGLFVLAISLLLAENGHLLALIILFPSFLLAFDTNATLAGILASVQFPLYYYLQAIGNSKIKKIQIISGVLLVHLIIMYFVIGKQNTKTTFTYPSYKDYSSWQDNAP